MSVYIPVIFVYFINSSVVDGKTVEKDDIVEITRQENGLFRLAYKDHTATKACYVQNNMRKRDVLSYFEQAYKTLRYDVSKERVRYIEIGPPTMPGCIFTVPESDSQYDTMAESTLTKLSNYVKYALKHWPVGVVAAPGPMGNS